MIQPHTPRASVAELKQNPILFHNHKKNPGCSGGEGKREETPQTQVRIELSALLQ